jgi:hypothetical protein
MKRRARYVWPWPAEPVEVPVSKQKLMVKELCFGKEMGNLILKRMKKSLDLPLMSSFSLGTLKPSFFVASAIDWHNTEEGREFWSSFYTTLVRLDL